MSKYSQWELTKITVGWYRLGDTAPHMDNRGKTLQEVLDKAQDFPDKAMVYLEALKKLRLIQIIHSEYPSDMEDEFLTSIDDAIAKFQKVLGVI